MSADFELEYEEIDDELSPERIQLKSRASVTTTGDTSTLADFTILISKNRICEFEILSSGTKIVATCLE